MIGARLQSPISRLLYTAFKNEHPGFHDPANPDFREQLERARERGLDFANRITKPGHYAAALSAFSAALRDGHAQVYTEDAFYDAVPIERQWPGFIANWRGDGMVVTRALPEYKSLVGSNATECDGMPVRELIERNVFALNHRRDEPGQWWSRAHNLFVGSSYDGLDLIGAALPAVCTFAHTEGASETRTLDWTDVPTEVQSENWFYRSWVGENSYMSTLVVRSGPARPTPVHPTSR